MVCSGRTFSYTLTGKAPFSAISSDNTILLNDTMGNATVATSPGILLVKFPDPYPTNNVTITIGDTSSPQNIETERIFCQ